MKHGTVRSARRTFLAAMPALPFAHLLAGGIPVGPKYSAGDVQDIVTAFRKVHRALLG